MHSTLRQIEPQIDDDPHDAPMIAPDIVPADWAERGPPHPANDATSRERLFAEIRNAAETAAPAVDTTFRASDVNDTPERKNTSAVRIWIKRGATAFVFALVSALAAAAWTHHGEVATQAVASWVPLAGASSSSSPDTTSATEQTEAAATADQQAGVTPPAQVASNAGALAMETDQQLQSMARDLAAMGQEITALKASIAQLKANQQAMAAVPPPAARPPLPRPQPKLSALPPRPSPSPPTPSRAPRQLAPATQAAAAPPPPIAAAPPTAYPPPPAQATVQPNGDPVVRPPAPLPLLPDR